MGSLDFNWSDVVSRAGQFDFLNFLGGQFGEAITTLIKSILPPALYLAGIWIGLAILWQFLQMVPGLLRGAYGTEKLGVPGQPMAEGFKQSWFNEEKQFGNKR